MASSFFDQPILNSPYEPPTRHHALDADGQPLDVPPVYGRRRSELITPVPKPRKKQRKAGQAEFVLTRSPGTLDGGAGIRRQRLHQRNPRPCRNLAGNPESVGLGCHASDPAPAHPLAPSPVPSPSRPFFCQIEAVETAIWLAEVARRERRYDRLRAHLRSANEQSNPELLAHRPEDGDRQRQDDGHGDADRLANRQRRADAGKQPLQPGLPRRHARHHHQGPPARPAAERPGQLLPPPRTRPDRHAAGHRQGQDRHHQLPRLQTPRDAGDQQDRPLIAPGPRRAAGHDRERRPDAASGRERPAGLQEHRGAQRRGAPLLPRKARQRRGTRARTNAKRPRRTAKPRGSGSAGWKRSSASWGSPLSTTCRPRRSSCAAPAIAREHSSPGPSATSR